MVAVRPGHDRRLRVDARRRGLDRPRPGPPGSGRRCRPRRRPAPRRCATRYPGCVTVCGLVQAPNGAPSVRHSKVTVPALSVPVNRSTAPVRRARVVRAGQDQGLRRDDVPPVRAVAPHVVALRAAATLPVARFPPRSIVPGLASMPQLPLSLAVLPDHDVGDVGDRDAGAAVVVGRVPVEHVAGPDGGGVADVDAVAVVVVGRVADEVVAQRQCLQRDAGAVGARGVVPLDAGCGSTTASSMPALLPDRSLSRTHVVVRPVELDAGAVAVVHRVVLHRGAHDGGALLALDVHAGTVDLGDGVAGDRGVGRRDPDDLGRRRRRLGDVRDRRALDDEQVRQLVDADVHAGGAALDRVARHGRVAGAADAHAGLAGGRASCCPRPGCRRTARCAHRRRRWPPKVLPLDDGPGRALLDLHADVVAGQRAVADDRRRRRRTTRTPATWFSFVVIPSTSARCVPGGRSTPASNWVDGAVGDGDVVVAVDRDAGAEAGPVERVPAEVDRDAGARPRPGRRSRQSSRSLSTTVLTVRTWPQNTSAVTAGGVTVQR